MSDTVAAIARAGAAGPRTHIRNPARDAEALVAEIQAAATPAALDALRRQLTRQLASLTGAGTEGLLVVQRVMLALSLRRAELHRPTRRTS